MTQATEANAPRHSRTRPSRTGVVTADSRDKTIRVSIDFLDRHEKYGKYLRRSTELHAHDEKNEAHVGDTVEIAECRPVSKTKRWRLVRVVKQAPKGAGA